MISFSNTTLPFLWPKKCTSGQEKIVFQNYFRKQSLFYYLIKSDYQILCAAQKVSFIKREGKIGDRISVPCYCSKTALLLCKTVHRNTEFGLTKLELKSKKVNVLSLQTAYALCFRDWWRKTMNLPDQFGSVIHTKRNRDNTFQVLWLPACTLQH